MPTARGARASEDRGRVEAGREPLENLEGAVDGGARFIGPPTAGHKDGVEGVQPGERRPALPGKLDAQARRRLGEAKHPTRDRLRLESFGDEEGGPRETAVGADAPDGPPHDAAQVCCDPHLVPEGAGGGGDHLIVEQSLDREEQFFRGGSVLHRGPRVSPWEARGFARR